MSRFSQLAMVCTLALLTPGCTQLFAKRAIERFAESMQSQNLDELKAATSRQFEERALRQDDAPNGLKLLKLPVGNISVVSIEDLENGKRKALVKVGNKENAKEVEYLLSKDSETGRWLVDDVIQKQDSGQGMIVTRSVAEQMDLLLTSRELLLKWSEGSREDKLAFCEPQLREHLTSLPPAWLEQLSKDISGPGQTATFKPDARLNGDRAIVAIPHTRGNVFLDMQQVDNRWQLRDLSVESSSRNSTAAKETNSIRALSKMAASLNQAAEFLTGYGAEDREKLARTASKDFYEKCLAAADLSEVPIPVSQLLDQPYEAKQFPDRVELLFHVQKSTHMLTLRQYEAELSDGTRDIAETRVAEVTFFDQSHPDEVKRLSSLLLSQAIVNLYVDALRARDVHRLEKLSTNDFNDRVWKRPEARHFAIMPDPQIDEGDSSILSTVFHGDFAEVTITQAELPMTLVLRHAQGWMLVDDVLLPAYNRPHSLKSNLQVLLPLQAFAAAAHRRDLQELIRCSADGLDRMAWKQLNEAPALCAEMVRPLHGEVVSIRSDGGASLVQTSDGETTALVKLVREGDHFVVQDVTLTPEDNPSLQVELLNSIRRSIALAQQSGTPARKTPLTSSDTVQLASAETMAPDSESPPISQTPLPSESQPELEQLTELPEPPVLETIPEESEQTGSGAVLPEVSESVSDDSVTDAESLPTIAPELRKSVFEPISPEVYSR